MEQDSNATSLNGREHVSGGSIARRRGRSITKAPVFRFFAYVRPHLWFVLGGMLMGIVKFSLPLAFPLAVKYVFDVLLVPQAKVEKFNQVIDRICLAIAGPLHLGTSNDGKLEALVLALLFLFIVQAAASYYRSYWAHISGHRLIFDLHYALFQHMQRLSHSYFDRTTSGAIVSRFLSDIQLAQNFVGSAMINMWLDAVPLTLVIWMLFAMDARLAWISLGVMPLYVIVIRVLTPRIKEASHQLQQGVEEFTGELQERVAGVSTVKSFAREDEEAIRFFKRTSELYRITIDNVKLSSQHQMYSEFIARVAPLAVIFAGALLIMRQTLSLGTMVAFYGLLGALYLPLQRFSELSTIIANSLAAIERIFTFLDEEPDVADWQGAVPLRISRGRVEFDHVSFSYGGSMAGGQSRVVLRDVNLTVDHGTRVALVGRSGAGKTTLASLIPRFYEPTSGRILIDGLDIAHATLKSLRANIGIVPQDAVMFTASIRENIEYGAPGASDAEIWHALEQANIRKFVESLPAKLNTVIGEDGIRPSTGQRQRLALARVFLKNPPILVLDEATSALDSEVENLIHDAIGRLMRGRTSFVIAHRLASAVEADVVVVLDQGAVVETGTHRELLARGDVFAQLYKEQTRTLVPQMRAHVVRDPGSLDSLSTEPGGRARTGT